MRRVMHDPPFFCPVDDADSPNKGFGAMPAASDRMADLIWVQDWCTQLNDRIGPLALIRDGGIREAMT